MTDQDLADVAVVLVGEQPAPVAHALGRLLAHEEVAIAADHLRLKYQWKGESFDEGTFQDPDYASGDEEIKRLDDKTEKQIQILKQWIDEGADWPEEVELAVDVKASAEDAGARLLFAAIRRTALERNDESSRGCVGQRD